MGRRLARKKMTPCPKCKTTAYLDRKTDYGGARYIDLHSIQCQWCSVIAPWQEREDNAVPKWNEWAAEKIAVMKGGD